MGTKTKELRQLKKEIRRIRKELRDPLLVVHHLVGLHERGAAWTKEQGAIA